jgi:retron-type reverse transcriptase
MGEMPVHSHPSRLSDWLVTAEAKKVHSLIDKVYQRKNLEIAGERVKANRGSGGIDGMSIKVFGERADQHLERLHEERRDQTYRTQPLPQVTIPKVGKPGENRQLGIPSIYDRVCQQALVNRLEPIFELTFDEANFGYRSGRSARIALRRVWKEIKSGREWTV